MNYTKNTREDGSVHLKIVKDDGSIIDYILSPNAPYTDLTSFEAFHNGRSDHYSAQEKLNMIQEQLDSASIAQQLINLFNSEPESEVEFIEAMIPHPGGSWFMDFLTLKGIS